MQCPPCLHISLSTFQGNFRPYSLESFAKNVCILFGKTYCLQELQTFLLVFYKLLLISCLVSSFRLLCGHIELERNIFFKYIYSLHLQTNLQPVKLLPAGTCTSVHLIYLIVFGQYAQEQLFYSQHKESLWLRRYITMPFSE